MCFVKQERATEVGLRTVGDGLAASDPLFENALLYYRKAGMNEQVKNLLIQNARKHPGKSNYLGVSEECKIIPW